ncbi:Beta-barrel assembly-enhancing protease [Meiothermus luteus]|uniref:Beta-barrel assembly-enhancing protease n=1 Tax=Meiothermus luteus TaxID=2026184 RepID=A0A399EBL2_9DEIN|nr:CPBP family intramembrane glutamic endopeptidase [Meiothermus luteus]RIH82044.1 Beta-barrel assembly-enhancing protease [Meiothermus luteus]
MDAGGYYAQCRGLYERGAPDSARATCELALIANPNHLPSLRLLARIYLEANNLEQAQVYLQRAAELEPQDPETALLTARYLLMTGRPAEALSHLPRGFSAEAVLLRAQINEALGNYEEAYALFRRVAPLEEARLGAARLAERLGRPQEAIGLLGDSPKEQVLKARLMWLSGDIQRAADTLEAVLPRLGPLDADYTRALGLLAMAYYGQGEFDKGALVLRQLSSRMSLPSNLLGKVWPWLVLLLVYLGLLLYGESRIEPMRTVEMGSERRFGPGTLHLWLLLSLVLAALASVGAGWLLYHNLLVLFTPYQGQVVRPIFYFLLGAFALLLAYRRMGKEGMANAIGPRANWVEGTWAGLVVLGLLGLYAYLAKPLNLAGLGTMYPIFFGLALLELVVRGVGYPVFKERYKELAGLMVPVLFALVIPGPTLFFLMAGLFLGWLYLRTRGALAGAVAWVLAGVVLALVANLPWVRTLLGS